MYGGILRALSLRIFGNNCSLAPPISLKKLTAGAKQYELDTHKVSSAYDKNEKSYSEKTTLKRRGNSAPVQQSLQQPLSFTGSSSPKNSVPGELKLGYMCSGDAVMLASAHPRSYLLFSRLTTLVIASSNRSRQQTAKEL